MCRFVGLLDLAYLCEGWTSRKTVDKATGTRRKLKKANKLVYNEEKRADLPTAHVQNHIPTRRLLFFDCAKFLSRLNSLDYI